MSGPDKLSLHIANDSMAIGVLLDDQRNRIMLYERVVFGIRRALGDDGLHAQLEDLPAAVAVLAERQHMEVAMETPHRQPHRVEPPDAVTVTREHMAALRELADDLDSIVQAVSSRDGDATARQHRYALGVRAALAALSIDGGSR